MPTVITKEGLADAGKALAWFGSWVGSHFKLGTRRLVHLLSGFGLAMVFVSQAIAQQSGAGQQLIVGSSSGRFGMVGTLTSLCGGIDAQGRLQEPCRPTPAKFEAEGSGGCAPGQFAAQNACWTCPNGFSRNILYAAGSDRACSAPDSSAQPLFFEAQFRRQACPDGSFRDGRGRCWGCPVGFERADLAGALSDNACIQSGVPRAQARRAQALFVQETACVKEEFLDLRNGGECWACPGETRRSTFPVTGPQACLTPGGLRFATATRGDIRQCAAGQIHDLLDSSNPNVAARIRVQFGGNIPPQLQQSLGRSTHGTCWTCPPESKRNASPVWSEKACRANVIEFQPAKYLHPGIFGLDGAENVAISLIRQRVEIERIAQVLGEDAGMSAAQAVRAAWEGIATAPQSSVVLQAALLARALAAAEQPQAATADEHRLAASVAEAIRRHRIYVAQTALDAYFMWSRTDVALRAQRNTNNLTALFDYGIPPPDFAKISTAAIMGGLGANAAASGVIAAITITPLNKRVFPFLRKAKTGATKGVGALGTIGPQIIVTIAVELIAQSIEQVIEINTAQPKLEAKLRVAQGPVNIAQLNQTDSGEAELMYQWSFMISGDTPPRNMAAFASMAKAP